MKRLCLIVCLLTTTWAAAQYQVVKHRGAGPPSSVGGGTCTAIVGGSTTCTVTISVTAGQVIVAYSTEYGSDSGVTLTVADSSSNSYSSTGTGTPWSYPATAGAYNNNVAWLATAASTNASLVITFTRSTVTANGMAAAVQYYDNLTTTLDVASGTLQLGIPYNVGNVIAQASTGATGNTTNATDVVIGLFGGLLNAATATYSAQSPFTLQEYTYTAESPNNIGVALSDYITNQVGVWATTMTMTTSAWGSGGGTILVLKAKQSHATTSSPITLVASTSCHATSGSTTSCTTPAVNSTGATLITAEVNGAAGSNTLISDSASNSWTGVGQISSNSAYGETWYVYAPTTNASHTFTCTFTYGTCYIQVWSGTLSTASVYDTTNSSYTLDPYLLPGAVTTSQAGELVVALYSLRTSPVSVPGIGIDSGFTLSANNGNSGDNYPGAAAYYIAPMQGPVNPLFWAGTGAGIQGSVAQITTFKH